MKKMNIRGIYFVYNGNIVTCHVLSAGG